jgi:hypothetical protein
VLSNSKIITLYVKKLKSYVKMSCVSVPYGCHILDVVSFKVKDFTLYWTNALSSKATRLLLSRPIRSRLFGNSLLCNSSTCQPWDRSYKTVNRTYFWQWTAASGRSWHNWSTLECMQYMMPTIPVCQNSCNICNFCRQYSAVPNLQAAVLSLWACF